MGTTTIPTMGRSRTACTARSPVRSPRVTPPPRSPPPRCSRAVRRRPSRSAIGPGRESPRRSGSCSRTSWLGRWWPRHPGIPPHRIVVAPVHDRWLNGARGGDGGRRGRRRVRRTALRPGGGLTDEHDGGDERQAHKHESLVGGFPIRRRDSTKGCVREAPAKRTRVCRRSMKRPLAPCTSRTRGTIP